MRRGSDRRILTNELNPTVGLPCSCFAFSYLYPYSRQHCLRLPHLRRAPGERSDTPAASWARNPSFTVIDLETGEIPQPVRQPNVIIQLTKRFL